MDRKAAIQEYKRKPEVGAIFRYVHAPSGWQGKLHSTPNLRGICNRLRFAQSSGDCVDFEMREQWNIARGKDIEVQVLEELKQGEDQSMADYLDDLETLFELWKQKEGQRE